jgi:rRNA-processing protein FCF1
MRLHPDERMDAFNFLKMFRIELDRLIEQSPSIPDSVIHEFNKLFKDNKDVVRPEITGILEHTNVYKDQNTRLKRIAAEAAIALNYKKGVIKQMVLDELEAKTRRTAIEAAREVAADVVKQQKAHTATLSRISRRGSITTIQKQERDKQIEEFRKENEGAVARIRNKFNSEAPKSNRNLSNPIVRIQEPPKENTIVNIINENAINNEEELQEKDLNFIDKKVYEDV